MSGRRLETEARQGVLCSYLSGKVEGVSVRCSLGWGGSDVVEDGGFFIGRKR